MGHSTSSQTCGEHPHSSTTKQPNQTRAPFLFQHHKNSQIQLRRSSCSRTTKQPNPAQAPFLVPRHKHRPPSCSNTTQQSNPAQVLLPFQHHKTTKPKQLNQTQAPFLFQHHKTTKSSSGALRVPAPKTIKSSSRPPSCSITTKQSNPAQVPGYKVSTLVCTG